MKMSAAFVRNSHTVNLFARGTSAADESFALYDVPRSFQLSLVSRPEKLWQRAISILKLKNALEATEKPDLYYCRQPLWGLLASFYQVPVFYELHKVPSTRYESLVTHALLSTRRFCGLVVISEALKRDVLKWKPALSSDQILAAPDGADLPKTPSDGTKSSLGQEAPSRVGYVGSLYAGRGIELIIDLASRLPYMTFEVVGGTGEQIEKWRSRVSSSNITFHGHFPHSEVADLTRTLDILVAPYQESVTVPDGADTAKWMSPMKIFEYMAAGRPIVCSDLPVLREVLTDRKDAMMVPPTDVAAWEDAITQLCNDKKLRQSLGDAARQSLENQYTWDRRAEKISEFIHLKMGRTDGH